MGWEIGYDDRWRRDIGYGVPAVCDHPDCEERIDRGLGYVCGGEPYGGELGCGLFFCAEHLFFTLVPDEDEDEEDIQTEPSRGFVCERCLDRAEPFTPKPDVEEWTKHKATDPSWAEWREKQAAKAGAH